MSRTIMINRKSVRGYREKDINGKGRAWVCARDFLMAAGIPCPGALVGDFLAEHLGAEAVVTRKVTTGGDTHRLIYVHAEVLYDLCGLYRSGSLHEAARLALTGISMKLGVKFMKDEPKPVKKVPATVPAKVQPAEADAISLYDFNGLSLRVIQIAGEPWFVGSDVLKAIYGRAAGIAHVYGVVNKDEKTKVKRSHLGMKPGRDVMVLSESGLYKLITRSDKAAAKPFQEWVTRDVLPSIRKTGSYSATDGIDETKTCPIAVATAKIKEAQLNDVGTVEDNFTNMVSRRRNQRTQQIAALQADLHALEIAQDKDNKLLALLAA